MGHKTTRQLITELEELECNLDSEKAQKQFAKKMLVTVSRLHESVRYLEHVESIKRESYE